MNVHYMYVLVEFMAQLPSILGYDCLLSSLAGSWGGSYPTDHEGYNTGQTATYTCTSNYVLETGDKDRVCQADGSFSGRAPKCRCRYSLRLFSVGRDQN